LRLLFINKDKSAIKLFAMKSAQSKNYCIYNRF